MNGEEVIILAIYIILLVQLVQSHVIVTLWKGCAKYKKKFVKLNEEHTKALDEIERLKKSDTPIHIVTYHVEPVVVSVTFTFPNYSSGSEELKRAICDKLAEKFLDNPDIFKVTQTNDPMNLTTTMRYDLKVIPYKEEK